MQMPSSEHVYSVQTEDCLKLISNAGLSLAIHCSTEEALALQLMLRLS